MIHYSLLLSPELLSEILKFHKHCLQSYTASSFSDTINMLLKYTIMDTSMGSSRIEFIQDYFEGKEWVLDKFLFEALKTGSSQLEQEI